MHTLLPRVMFTMHFPLLHYHEERSHDRRDMFLMTLQDDPSRSGADVNATRPGKIISEPRYHSSRAETHKPRYLGQGT